MDDQPPKHLFFLNFCWTHVHLWGHSYPIFVLQVMLSFLNFYFYRVRGQLSVRDSEKNTYHIQANPVFLVRESEYPNFIFQGCDAAIETKFPVFSMCS